MKTAGFHAAEWILSLVLAPDRAAAITGDLIEGSAEHGSRWFWMSVLRTALSRVWSDLAESPATMARIGLGGYALSMPVAIGLVFVADSLMNSHLSEIHYRHGWLWSAIMIKTASYPPLMRWQAQLAGHLVWASSQLLTGRWVARRALGREAAGCAAVSAAGWAALLLWYRDMRPILVFLPVGITHDVILLAAALWLRRHTARSIAA